MVGKREAKRLELTTRLLRAAQQRIARQGLAGLRARDITADADCGLGTIYKCFDDLDDLIFRVNATTLDRLDAALSEAVSPGDTPQTRLVALATAYLDFAVANPHLWVALFEHRGRTERPYPDWYIKQQTALFQHVIEPLLALDPELPEAERPTRARSVFSAVHGIIALSLEDRVIGVGRDVLVGELEHMVRVLADGLTAAAGRRSGTADANRS